MSKTKTVFLALAIVFAYGVFHWSNAQLAKQPTTMQVLTPKLANLGYKDNEILLVVPENLDGFPKSKTYQRISDLLTKKGLKLLGRVPLANIPLLNPRFARVCGGLLERWILPSGEVLNTVKTLGGTISAIDRRYVIAPNTIGHPPQAENDWASRIIKHVPTSVPKSDKPVRIAVLDTFLRNQPFAPNDVWDAITIWADGLPPLPLAGEHGTGVSSIIAGPAPVGIAPGIARIDFMRVCDNDGACYDHSVLPAYCRALNRGARVINMSFASFVPSDLLKFAIEDAQHRSLKQTPVNVVAAGNSKSSAPEVVAMRAAGGFADTDPMYPAAYSNGNKGPLDSVLAVGATDQSMNYATFASVGKYIDVMGPGVQVPTYDPTGPTLADGTSFSAPYVSAAAALLIAQKTNIQATSVENLIRSCITPLPAATNIAAQSTAGLLNITQAQLKLTSGTGTACP